MGEKVPFQPLLTVPGMDARNFATMDFVLYRVVEMPPVNCYH